MHFGHRFSSVCCFLLLLMKHSLQGKYERKLLKHLFQLYNVLERPVGNESEPIQVSFSLTLEQIINLDEKHQILTTNCWLNVEWIDFNLRWNASEFGDITDVRVASNRIWRPDILLYNSADDSFDSTYHSNIIVTSNGSCVYIPPGIFKSTCKIDITWFPFDDQYCEMKFGSWTYNGLKLDLNLQQGDTSGFLPNGEWDLIEMPSEKNVQYYACCPEPFVDVTYIIHIRRRTSYYFSNFLLPCIIISSMAILGFTLPPECGEKLTLGITILLSLVVFSNMFADKIPASSDAVPLIGSYFNCMMFMVATSVVTTVLALNYHHRLPDMYEMPKWFRSALLQWMPWLLRMSVPNQNDKFSDNLKENNSNFSTSVCRCKETSNIHYIEQNSTESELSESCYDVRIRNEGYFNFSHVHCELELVLEELKYITYKIKQKNIYRNITNDWKFAAMVIDRICLIIFTFFSLSATVAILITSRNMIIL